ncbi:MAG: hypothetical protein P1U86_05745 [Verrucomicrobiales bacterium]|nr:hypothetical protein [Verrucomicrobiales bacterium]
MKSLINITDADIVAAIDAANMRVVLLTPGLSKEVAEAIARAWNRLHPESVSVIVDTDPEVCRMGYGTIEAIKIAQLAASEHGQLVAHQPGIRLGVLMADQNTLIFSPAPHLIEAGSDNPEHPNGIILHAPPETLADDLGAGEDSVASRTIGLEKIDEDRVKAIAADLEENPPQKFDIARIQRVFNAKLEFVEFELEGCYISRHSVQIPSDLVGLAQKDPATKNKFRSTFRLIEKDDVIDSKGKISEKSLLAERTRITRKFLVPLKDHGVVILRSNKEAFQEELKSLEQMVESFQTALSAKLEKIFNDNAKRLTKALFPSVVKNPPERWIRFLGANPKPPEIKVALFDDLLESFGDPEQLIRAMRVVVKFKGVTYESLKNDDFKGKAAAAFPNLKLHDEFGAARGEQPELF